MVNQPLAHFAHGKPVPHRHGSSPNETFPSFLQDGPLDRPACRVGPVQHPYRFAMLGRRLQHISQGRDKCVDSAAQILKIDQHDIACIHRLRRRPPDFAVKAENRNIVNRIKIVLGFDHIVLLVAPQTMLRTKSRSHIDPVQGRKHVQRMGQIARDRCRMREQRHPLSFQRLSEFCLFDKPVYSKFHRDFAIFTLWRKQSRL